MDYSLTAGAERKNHKKLHSLLGLNAEKKLIGCVARLDPSKGQHEILASRVILQEHDDVEFVLIGSDIRTQGDMKMNYVYWLRNKEFRIIFTLWVICQRLLS